MKYVFVVSFYVTQPLSSALGGLCSVIAVLHFEVRTSTGFFLYNKYTPVG